MSLKLTKDIKIIVHSEEHGKLIHERMISLLDLHRCRFSYVKGMVLYYRVGCVHGEWGPFCYYKKFPYRKTTLDDLYNKSTLSDFTTPDSPCQGKTVEIDGVRYKLVRE